MESILPTTDFSELSTNWFDLDPAKTDESLYYKSDLQTTRDGRQSWYRALMYELTDDSQKNETSIDRLKKLLATCDYSLVHLGIEYDNSEMPLFRPFLELTNDLTAPMNTQNCFHLKVVDHPLMATEKEHKGTNEHMYNHLMSSAKIPYKFALEMKDNWLVGSPSEMADNFKVIENKGYDLLQYVNYYIYDSRKNLINAEGQNAVERIDGFFMSLGLNLNKKSSDLPTFSPILVYTLVPEFSSYGSRDEVNVPPGISVPFYEELARPCPPTCHN